MVWSTRALSTTSYFKQINFWKKILGFARSLMKGILILRRNRAPARTHDEGTNVRADCARESPNSFRYLLHRLLSRLHLGGTTIDLLGKVVCSHAYLSTNLPAFVYGSTLSHLYLLHTWLPALPILPSICARLTLLIQDLLTDIYSESLDRFL